MQNKLSEDRMNLFMVNLAAKNTELLKYHRKPSLDLVESMILYKMP